MKKKVFPPLVSSLAIGTLVIVSEFAAAAEAEWFLNESDWKFSNGPEYPGARGSFTLAEIDGRNAGKLDFDFSEGGGYVLGAFKVPEGDFSRLQFAVKGNTPTKVMIRVDDSNRECFQVRVNYTMPGEWQTFEVDFQEPQLVFGGDGNKMLDLPVTRVYLGATSKGPAELGGEPAGEIYFGDVMPEE